MELDFIFTAESYQTYTDSNSAHLLLLHSKGDGFYSVLYYCFLSWTSLEIPNIARKIRLKNYTTGFLNTND